MSRVLVTGANGFVGTSLCPLLARAGYVVRAAMRGDKPLPAGAHESVVVGNIGGRTDWTPALSGVDAVIHLAGLAHRLKASGVGADGHLDTNARGTQRLAADAVNCGIRRLVYLSSIKVNGEETRDAAYSPRDVPDPRDAYSVSKWRGEESLAATVSGTPVQATVVRAPLVYGPGVRANFLRLLRWVDHERWLPLGALKNRRSLVSVWNLCDLLIRVLDHPVAAGNTWMVSDDEDVSTPELVRRIARALDRQARLVSVPSPLLRLTGTLLGKGAEIRALCGSLTVNIASTRERLGWTPPLPMDEGLGRTARWYRSSGAASR
jgi:nucleoside-diphosphate-sugar epimerase